MSHRNRKRLKHNDHGLHVEVVDNNVADALRRLKKRIESAGVFDELRKRRFYTKPSVAKRLKKSKAAHLYKIARANEDKKRY